MPTNDQGVTVQRQYIGARYVPKFFQGENGDPSWVAGIAYEPLTIVTYLGNSFTSKIPVPVGIGNPAQNPTYWANTGNYSAQIAEYQQQVADYKQIADTTQQGLEAEVTNREAAITAEQTAREASDTGLQAQINELKTTITSSDPTIFISDSYGSYPSTTDNWMTRTVAKLGLTNVQYIAQGSTGFTTTPSWLTMLQQAVIPDKNAIKFIIIGGGANDTVVGQSYNTIYTAANNFMAYALSEFPNAQIILCPFGYGQGAHGDHRANMVKAYYDQVQPRVKVPKNICYVLQNKNYLLTNSVHPNNSGVTEIVNKLCTWLLTGQCEIIYYSTSQSVTGIFTCGFNESLINDVWSMSLIEGHTDKSYSLKYGAGTYNALSQIWFGIYSFGNSNAMCGVRGYAGANIDAGSNIFGQGVIWAADNEYIYLTLSTPLNGQTTTSYTFKSNYLSGTAPSLMI